MPANGRPSRARGVLQVAGLALIVLALGACSSAAKRRWLEVLFDEPPSRRAEQVQEQAAPEGEGKAARREPTRSARARLFPAQGSIHGPYAADLCRACHLSRGEDTSSSGVGLSLARLRVPETELCTSCHLVRELRDVAPDPRARLHGPVAAGRCTSCHAAHAARQRHLLIRPAGELCAECHGASRGADHPEADAADCLDCHDPHVVGDFGS